MELRLVVIFFFLAAVVDDFAADLPLDWLIYRTYVLILRARMPWFLIVRTVRGGVISSTD